MELYGGIDVSLEDSSVCITDRDGAIRRETKVMSDPEALARLFRDKGCEDARIGLEAAPRKYQSGELDLSGHITRSGDASVRTVLYEAANAMITLSVRPSDLKRWALRIVKRRGAKRAKVALARKLAVVMRRMWIDGTDFDFGATGVRPAA